MRLEGKRRTHQNRNGGKQERTDGRVGWWGVRGGKRGQRGEDCKEDVSPCLTQGESIPCSSVLPTLLFSTLTTRRLEQNHTSGKFCKDIYLFNIQNIFHRSIRSHSPRFSPWFSSFSFTLSCRTRGSKSFFFVCLFLLFILMRLNYTFLWWSQNWPGVKECKKNLIPMP